MMNLTTNIKTNLKLILVVPFIVAIVGCGKQTSNPTTKCDADECIETSACVDGSVEAIACGLNNTGTQTQTCTGGEWDYGTCSDPDICVNAATQTQACGLNNGGIQTVTCTHGEWVENFCSDSDVCKNGDTQVAPCGLENNGMMTRVCAEGEWSSFGVCVDPDMCDEDAPSTFIVGGAIECGFPAVGALMEDGRPFCTGTLISPTAVLTAAHCVDFWTSSSKYEFFMGTDANNAQSGTMIEVSAHYPHPQWTDLNSASYPVRCCSHSIGNPGSDCPHAIQHRHDVQ